MTLWSLPLRERESRFKYALGLYVHSLILTHNWNLFAPDPPIYNSAITTRYELTGGAMVDLSYLATRDMGPWTKFWWHRHIKHKVAMPYTRYPGAWVDFCHFLKLRDQMESLSQRTWIHFTTYKNSSESIPHNQLVRPCQRS